MAHPLAYNAFAQVIFSECQDPPYTPDPFDMAWPPGPEVELAGGVGDAGVGATAGAGAFFVASAIAVGLFYAYVK